MQEMEHKHVTEVDSDHPAVLVGQDEAPTPGRVRAARHRRLPDRRDRQRRGRPGRPSSPRSARPSRATSTSSASSGSSDGSVRNGYQQIKVTFHIEGDADDATLRAIVEQSRRRSAVYDVLTQPTPVSIEVVDRLTAGSPLTPRRTGHAPTGRGRSRAREGSP